MTAASPLGIAVNQLSALSRTAAGRLGLLAAILLLLAFAMRFWLHDAVPYLLDYSEESYSRYWPHRGTLLIHIAGGTIALLAGPFQLWTGLRNRYRRLHRATGYAYIAGVAVSALSSFYLAFYANADFGLSLFILAIVWLATIAMALVAVRNRRIDAHQEWMIRSYIVTFSFASYRYLVKLSVFAGLGSGRQATVLWISWVVPMILFELFTQLDRVRPLKRRAAQPATATNEAPERAWL
jgi:uncharacterized membrane protein